MDWFEVASAVITAVAVLLTARQIVWCWPVTLISVAMYTAVFWDARLYADAGLQVIYGGFAVYGWWSWVRGGTGGGALRVSRLSAPKLLAALGAGAVASFSLATALSRWTDAAVPWADATLTCFSLVAQWMAARKKIENWVLWIVLDVGYVALFLERKLLPTAILYAAFLALAVFGLQQWHRSTLDDRSSS